MGPSTPDRSQRTGIHPASKSILTWPLLNLLTAHLSGLCLVPWILAVQNSDGPKVGSEQDRSSVGLKKEECWAQEHEYAV